MDSFKAECASYILKMTSYVHVGLVPLEFYIAAKYPSTYLKPFQDKIVVLLSSLIKGWRLFFIGTCKDKWEFFHCVLERKVPFQIIDEDS